jgi:hypothetical protein
MRNYEQVMKALARSERVEDRQLAIGLVRCFCRAVTLSRQKPLSRTKGSRYHDL